MNKIISNFKDNKTLT